MIAAGSASVSPTAFAHAPATTQASAMSRPGLADLVRLTEGRVDAWVQRAVELATSDLASSERRGAVRGGREHTAAVLELLRNQRRPLVAALAAGLRRRFAQAAMEAGSRLAASSAMAAGPGAAAPTPGSPTAAAAPELSLSLIDEEEIDEDIEISRIVQLIEAEAEAELQDLAALASTLVHLDHVDPAVTPLRPQVCAQGLREGLRDALAGRSLDPAARLLLLRVLGAAAGRQIRREYVELAEHLRQQGVRPAPFRIRPAAGAARHAEEPEADAEEAEGEQALQRLVRWARATAPAPLDGAFDPVGDSGFPAPTDSGAPTGPLSFLAEPRARSGREEPPLSREAAEHALGRLFAQLGEMAEWPAQARGLLGGLHRIGLGLAARDGTLWSNPEHPWWRLIDRLLAIGAAHGELPAADQRRLHESLIGVLTRLQQAPHVDDALLGDAADDLRAFATRLLQGDAGALMDQVSALQQQADRQELRAALRIQVVQQLRSTRVSTPLRQFLVGPWTHALAAAAQAHGQSSPELARFAVVVDELIRATAMPGRPVSATQRVTLLRQVEAGLAASGLPPAKARDELAHLAAVLHRPPPAEEPDPTWEDAAETMPAGLAQQLHADLPTVPMDDLRAAESADGASAEGAAAWMDRLQAGTYCRLYLQGEWTTARLHWVSPTRNLFLFAGRPHGRTHSLTRRILAKLRDAGLAASLGDGARLAGAIDRLTAGTGSPGR